MAIVLDAPPEVNRQSIVESEVKEIVDLILSELPQESKPLSVLWYGGFARGESGLYQYRNRWLPFGDYDLEVVCQDTPNREVVEKIEASITGRFGYRPVQASVDETLVADAVTYNVMDLKFSTPEQFLGRSPDLSTYDLIHASEVLYGEDLRTQIELEIDQVPKFSAYRILQNRLFNTLSLFNLDLWDTRRELTHQEKVAFSLAICRIWLDFGMALSLCLDCYAPDHQTRLANIQEHEKKMALWFRNWKGLINGIRVAIDFKKNPKPNQLNVQAIRHGYFLALESWDRVMRVIQAKLLPYHFGRGYEMDKIDYWVESAETCLKVFPRRYYREYLKTLLSRQQKSCPDWKLNLLARGANIYENLGFMGPGTLLRHPRRSFISPEIIYFACVPLLAYSITPVGKVHFGMLSQVTQLISPYRKCQVTLTGKENWQQVKDFSVNLFNDYRRAKTGGRTLPKWLKKR